MGAAARRLFEASSVSKGHQPWDAQVNDRIKQQFRADAHDALKAAIPSIIPHALEGAVEAVTL